MLRDRLRAAGSVSGLSSLARASPRPACVQPRPMRWESRSSNWTSFSSPSARRDPRTTSYPSGMAAEDTHGLGYRRVDEDPNIDVLIATMDGTAGWDATRRLRSWERAQLGLAHGQRLLDVGCGLGEAALGLAPDLGDSGEIVGIDLSEGMLRIARTNAATARCRVRFTVGDAYSLDEPDDSFDAARSERTLQWLADPGAAVAELVRVVRPGGRISLIDTDWSTFTIDVGDEALAALVRDGDANGAQSTLTRRPATARPHRRCRVRPARANRGDAGLDDLGPGRIAGTAWMLLDGEPRRRSRRHRSAGDCRPPAVRVDDPRCRAARSVLDEPHDVRGRGRCPRSGLNPSTVEPLVGRDGELALAL